MKKQLFSLLVAALLTPTIHAGAPSKIASGAWQLVKIGGGAILVTAGAGFAFVPWCAACGLGIGSCVSCCDQEKETASVQGKGACCCATIGFILGAPTAIAGGVMIKSGIKGLKKIFSHKHHHHHHEYVDIAVHANNDND